MEEAAHAKGRHGGEHALKRSAARLTMVQVYMFRLIIEWAALLAEPEALPS